MTVLRDANTSQVEKLESNVSLNDLSAQRFACPGDCWDCDSCGGSQTH